MVARQLPHNQKFLVAFSFAGEQRALVQSIAEAVEIKLGPSAVFLDDWYEHYIAGNDGDLKLQNIYSESLLVVVCVSESYGNKSWPGAEYEAIRARQMRSRALHNDSGKYDILPIRVGDGEVPGIFINTIVPDARKKHADETAQLVVDRLQLICPGLNPKADRSASATSWLDTLVPLTWSMANHSGVREAFGELLLRNTSKRCLLVSGSSESGKSHITQQMLSNALHLKPLPGLACGRLDFKGTTDIDAEVRIFVQHLDVPLPSSALVLNERLNHILDALRRKAIPTLLIFDTYEAAGTKMQDWVEKQLLPSIIRSTWLRIVIVGQRVPDPHGTIWEVNTFPTLILRPPQSADWFEYSRRYRPEVTLSDVETGCTLARNKPSILAHLFGPLRK
ncbi:TIR domain-containing protein [Nitrosospira sp. Is2]|uniref:TIR domain-containing protein n=1 Tax=Nitrosospira sp. Is2 TaxID=3080532 RepID=UPI002953107B|nr:TIR domain-containing protein [Nitrosospira sp. Is2]WON74170.1 TIR domain-containing protein [Nitrosospira sp. Is2]